MNCVAEGMAVTAGVSSLKTNSASVCAAGVSGTTGGTPTQANSLSRALATFALSSFFSETSPKPS